jgi:hypothetical protein
VRSLCLALGMLIGVSAAAQDVPAKKKKKPATQVKAHKKPTPEQIRRFNELQKKQQP